MALRLSVLAAVRGILTGAPDIGTADYNLDMPTVLKEFAPGASAGQVSKLFTDRRTLAGFAAEDIDLSGALVDPLGQTAVFTVVKALLVKADPANANPVVVGGAASNGFVGPFGAANDTVAVPPGGCLLLVHPGAGWTVTAGTADLLHVANGGAGSATYDIVIAG